MSQSLLGKIYSILSNYSLYLSIILLVLVFFSFYPSKFASLDEHDYLNNTNLILDGQLRQACDTNSLTQFAAADYCISKYNLGTSLFFIPVLLNKTPQLAFATTFVVFLVGVILFYLILKSLKIDPIFTYAYAFYPSFVFFSRTLFSETFSATLILLIVFLLVKFTLSHSWKIGLTIGLISGLAVFVRYENCLPIGLMLVCFWASELQVTWRNIWYFNLSIDKFWHYIAPILVGLIPVIGTIMATNMYVYGGLFHSGYYYSGEQMLDFANAPLMLVRFGLALCLAYPGMLVIAFLTKMTQKYWLLVPALASIIFYLGFPNTMFEGRLLDLVVALRFVVPVIPLLLILYVKWLNQYTSLKLFRAVIVLAILALGVNVWYMSKLHQEYLQTSAPNVGQEILKRN